jgi:hypothetical protein
MMSPSEVARVPTRMPKPARHRQMAGNKAQEGSSRPSCVRRPNFRSLVFPFFDLLAEDLAVAGVHDDLV